MAMGLISVLVGLVGCDPQRIAELEEGVATEADVRTRFGEPEKIWEAAGTVHVGLLGHGGVAVHINLDDAHLAAVLGGHLLQNRGHSFARAAPGGVKIDQHRHARAVDEF